MDSINLYQFALNEITSLEDHFQINMDKEMFYSELLPNYFNIKIDNVNINNYDECIGIIYNFEVDEGSASIICKYVDYFNVIEIIGWNSVLSDHLSNRGIEIENL